MQADRYFAAHDQSYAATWATGRRLYALDVKQLTRDQAQEIMQAFEATERAHERSAQQVSGRPKLTAKQRAVAAAKTRAYAEKMRQRAVERNAAKRVE